MRNTWYIFTKELRQFFVSPVAYVVIALFLAISGIFFYLLLQNFIEYGMRSMIQAQQYRMQPPPINVNQMMIRPLFLNMAVITLFMLPMITMRLFADEKKTGTVELLFTSPLTSWQIILGKFIAGLTVYLAMIGSTAIHIAVLFLYGDPEFMPVLSGYLGLALMGAGTVAMGGLISSLTENQIIAAVGCFGALMILWFIGWASSLFGPATGAVLQYLSIIGHFEDFAKGVLDTGHLVFYASFAFFMLFATYQSVESTKWRG